MIAYHRQYSQLQINHIFIIKFLKGMQKDIVILWNILQQESRVIKSVVDIYRIVCKFVSFDFNRQEQHKNNSYKQNTIIIQFYHDLRLLHQYYPQSSILFGKNEQQQAKVNQYLSFYQIHLKKSLRLELKQYFCLQKHPIGKQKIHQKLQQMYKALAIINSQLQKAESSFLLGEDLTIVDLLLYFDICNLTYFRRNHLKYKAVSLWFARVYQIKQIKVITHQWFSMAKEISAMFKIKQPNSTL